MSDSKDLWDSVWENFDIQSFMDYEGITYKEAEGHRGRQLNLQECPACGDSRYKVYINAETGFGNCFHGECEIKYNKYVFVKEFLQLDKPRDVIEAAKDFLVIQGWRPKINTAVKEKSQVELYLPDIIPADRNPYLIKRGISQQTIDKFNISYCEKGSFEYQDFSNRIIFPIYDIHGELKSFQGRDITGKAEKKYIFPAGFASTGSIVYNADQAVGAEQVVISEGVFDVLALSQIFEKDSDLVNVVPLGSFGIELCHRQDENDQFGVLMDLKGKGLKEVTFMWDSEPKAIEKALAAAELLRRNGINSRLAILPKGKDPSEASHAEVVKAFWDASFLNTGNIMRIKMKLL